MPVPRNQAAITTLGTLLTEGHHDDPGDVVEYPDATIEQPEGWLWHTGALVLHVTMNIDEPWQHVLAGGVDLYVTRCRTSRGAALHHSSRDRGPPPAMALPSANSMERRRRIG